MRIRHLQIALLTLALLLVAVPTLSQEAPPAADGGASPESTKTPAELLKEGTLLLTSGRATAALQSFDAAISADPTNYLSYYRRATALLSLGRTNAALGDLEALLKLNPTFAQAHFQRAKALAKEGDLEPAQKAVEEFLKLKKADEEGVKLKESIAAASSALKSLRSAAAAVDKAVKAGKDFGKDMAAKAKADECARFASIVIDVAPSNLEARRLRAACALAQDDLPSAMADWSRIAHLAPTPALLMRLSSLSYYVVSEAGSGQRDAALTHLKACLNSDPDNRLCARAHKRLRGFEKTLKKARNFADGDSWRPVLSSLRGPKVGGPSLAQEIEAAIKADAAQPEAEDAEPVLPKSNIDYVEQSNLLQEVRELQCRAHVELDEIKKAIPICTVVLKRNADYAWALAARGEEHLQAERYEEAVRDLDAALKASGGQNRALHAKLNKAQKRLKLSQTKDYYKVLGVSRNADAKEIKKAYRAKAREHHPDKGGKPEKMAEINEAFGVLGNDELRARFDQGDDPNDPAGGQSHNPFGGGGGMPFEFFQQGGFPGGSHGGRQGGGNGYQQHFSWNFG